MLPALLSSCISSRDGIGAGRRSGGRPRKTESGAAQHRRGNMKGNDSCRPRTIYWRRRHQLRRLRRRPRYFFRQGRRGRHRRLHRQRALKAMEGAARLIGEAMREEFSRNPLRKLGYLAARPALKALRARIDPRRYKWREHGRVERHRHQESRRHRRIRFSGAIEWRFWKRATGTGTHRAAAARIARNLKEFDVRTNRRHRQLSAEKSTDQRGTRNAGRYQR